MNIFFLCLFPLTSAFVFNSQLFNAGNMKLSSAARSKLMTELGAKLATGDDDSQKQLQKFKKVMDNSLKQRRPQQTVELKSQIDVVLEESGEQVAGRRKEEEKRRRLAANEVILKRENAASQRQITKKTSKKKQFSAVSQDPPIGQVSKIPIHAPEQDFISLTEGESNSSPSDTAPPVKQIARPVVEGQQQFWYVAAEQPYYGYWSPYPIEEPEFLGEVWSTGCPLCTVIVNHKSRPGCIRHMNRHIKIVHDKVRDFQCPTCSYATGVKSDLTRHSKICRQRTRFPSFATPVLAVSNGTLAEEFPYFGYWSPHPFEEPQMDGQLWRAQCPLCDVAVSTTARAACIRDLNKHVKLKHGPVAAQHPYHGYWSPFPFEKPVRTAQGWNATCPLCEVTKAHQFKKNCIQELNRHVKVVHEKVRDFRCPHCAFASGYKSALQRHLRAQHK